ncbi:MAG: [Fe-Fe] hydrogenase large subunit C-terminal domain-containing protein [Clostridia bacterium]
MIRHPDMPKVIFKVLWENLKAGKNFHAIVKNLARSGRYYWVITDFEIAKDENGEIQIDAARCTGCGECLESCMAKNLVPAKEVLAALHALHRKSGPKYALVAPAFLGQFSADVTPGKLREALRALGFDGMIEVALFADILTLKEALEFDRNIKTESDFQLTSCCCPIWIAMIRKVFGELMPHVPGSVSPMIACGRTVKILHPDAVTFFIGPCVAKKAEAREPDLKGAVDFVLTFEELRDAFDAAGIDPRKMPESHRDHSSRAGRIYARAGGVSEAVKSTLERISPGRAPHLHAQHADGVSACREMMKGLKEGTLTANFYEGMGCAGGCVGGPKVILPPSEGMRNVNEYGDSATYKTPIDNPYVIELLNRLGFNTIEALLEKSDIFTREF